jgi:hypothetical protein
MATTELRLDLDRCPFCGDGIDSPGAGFIAHLREASDCADDFERWRDRIGDDMPGGWAG